MKISLTSIVSVLLLSLNTVVLSQQSKNFVIQTERRSETSALPSYIKFEKVK